MRANKIMSTTPPVNPTPYASPPSAPPQLPVKQGLSPLAWGLIIVGGLFTLCIILFVAGGMFLFHKVKQAGFDPDLMRKNPSLAVSKMITSANPNTEVVNIDEAKGIIHIRDKQTGKTFTMNFADAKSGKMVLQEDGKDAVTITATGDGQKANVVIQSAGKDTVTMNASGDGKNGTVEIKTADGVSTVGEGAANAPAWMPVYPGSQPEGLVGADTAEGATGSFHFVTKDAIERVTDFYKERLKTAGLKVGSSTTNDADGSVSAVMQAEDAAKGRTALIVCNSENGGTSVTASFKQAK